ncbi:MAG: hypothetical protein H0T49_10060, partial [Chloroflexia bacterium]|nr:hypothetical protein [Chloroflexia bacterium]
MRIWGVLQNLFMLLVLFSVPLVSVAQVSTPVSAPGLEEAVEWLVTRQEADGSFAGFSGEPDAGTTGDAALALAAAGTAGIEVAVPLANARDFLLTEGAAYAATGPGQAAKLYLALVAADCDPASIEGDDLAA